MEEPAINTLEEKLTRISLLRYDFTTGIIMPYQEENKDIAYFTDSPEDVLIKTFRLFDIINFNNCLVLPDGDYVEYPKVGLGIAPYEEPMAYGLECSGNLEYAMRHGVLDEAKRDTPVTSDYTQSIIRRLERTSYAEQCGNPDAQNRQDRNQIIDILKAING